jgi:uncharacterized membrane protein
MATTHHPGNMYPVARVPVTRPFIWLSRGWDDLLHHRGSSLAYGLLVSTLGALILGYQRHPYYVAAVVTGFLLVGPIITAGVCELSRAQDNGEPTDFDTSLKSLRRNTRSLLRFSETLSLLAIAWFFMSWIMLSGMIEVPAPSLANTVWGDVLQQLSRVQLIAYLASGGGLAAIVFALSVISVPMMVERHVSAATAMGISLRVAVRDWPAMLVWGALIVALVAVGFATYLLAMIVIFPLLGHATWYAYRDLIH